MTDELKNVRLPVMVTQSEMEAIDEWRYSNKIPTRAEAIRRLIQRGIHFDGNNVSILIVAGALLEFKATGSIREESLAKAGKALRRVADTLDSTSEFEKIISKLEADDTDTEVG